MIDVQPEKETYDLIVIGAGSGGLAAAKRAASYGANVAIIEGDKIGGTCVIRGCVPKKLLVYGATYRDYVANANSYGIKFKEIVYNQSHLLENIREEVSRLNKFHIDALIKSKVEIIEGWASFKDKNRINVKNRKNNSERVLEAKNFLIAVGSQPKVPDMIGSELAWVSDDMFLQKDFPEEVVIVGAGFIACEFACILNGLGVKVVQLVRGNSLLRGFDGELCQFLQSQMKDNGIKFVFASQPIEIRGSKNNLNLLLNSGESIQAGGVLFATGRSPLTEGLCLEKLGIELNSQAIVVDKENRTNISNIFAVGDVTNRVNLTPVAIDEGRAFSDRLFGSRAREVNYDLIPKAVFSQPELATVGLTQEEAISIYGIEGIKIYRAKFKAMSQALHEKGNRCLLKLIVSTKDERILGCHMVGEHSAEIIQMASIALKMGACKIDFDNTMALHPTIAEEFVTMI